MKYRIYLFFFLSSFLLSQEISILGRIIDAETNEPVIGANIFSGELGTVSNLDGEFVLVTDADSLTITFIGYRQKTQATEARMLVKLLPKVLQGETVWVEATRAVTGITPVAFSNLTPEEINYRYTVEDVPMVLSSEPGVYAYSESGNGTGYSYVSIRGFDQSRIAVMLNGVPLNDNESHQVYWVDHADILSDAIDVQIQRGIGNSLYGSSAFGGSINILTGPGTDKGYSFKVGAGSFNTKKSRIKYTSPKYFDGKLQLFTRLSILASDGYRDYHQSDQSGIAAGLDYHGLGGRHEFRALKGYERSHLAWDGVPMDAISNREKRKESYKAYIDDFTQQMYSLRSIISINSKIRLTNVAYLVKGKGYYETEKYSESIYDYNLDLKGLYPDSLEQIMETGFLRRKWIVNSYAGVIPTISLKTENARIDLGLELRSYTGDHFGEISNFTNDNLVQDQSLGDNWYKYYSYLGSKRSATVFGHVSYKILPRIRLIADLQLQRHDWDLDQEKIGHAEGHKINALWEFVNPRAGIVSNLNENFSIFLNYGKGQKEPADAQIISADDVWATPVFASAEVIHDYEAGASFKNSRTGININFFKIDYYNEQLKNIDIEKQGEYEYSAEEATTHSGVEFDLSFDYNSNISGGFNATFLTVKNNAGEWLPGVPDNLINVWTAWTPIKNNSIYVELKHVGNQRIIWDWENRMINPSTVVNMKWMAELARVNVSLKINNVFDALYETQAYAWDTYYYWPGATRNFFIEIETNL